MADESYWQAFRGERKVNESNVHAYGLLIENQRRLAQALMARGISEEVVREAFERCENQVPVSEDVRGMCARILALTVAEFGGRLELRAVFEDEAVTLLNDDDSADADPPESC